MTATTNQSMENLLKEPVHLDIDSIKKAKKILKKQKWITWFCTIFSRKNNRALRTFNTTWVMSESSTIWVLILNWFLCDLSELDKDILDNIKLFLYDETLKVELSKWSQELFHKFNKKYRLLLSNKL